VSDPNWSNVGRVFDGTRLTARKGGAKVDVFSGAVVKVTPDSFNTPSPTEQFHGTYGTLEKLVPNATLEPYALWRLAHGYKGERGGMSNLDTKTFGMRWVGKLPAGLDYGIEMAGQRGSIAHDPVSAWAGHWVVGRRISQQPHKPRIFSEYNRATGDDNARDGRRGAFDPLYPGGHDKYGLSDLFTWTNIQHWRTGFEYTFRKGDDPRRAL
jgi:hypothetical protein